VRDGSQHSSLLSCSIAKHGLSVGGKWIQVVMGE
jgi:hypothetical protein